jgi:ribokinase
MNSPDLLDPRPDAVRPQVFVLGNFVQACCWHVPQLPRPGETCQASALHIEPGGKGLNVAVGLQRLGAQVQTLIGCGTDPAGDTLLALLRAEGIGTAHVYRFEGASGWGAGLIDGDGRNVIAVYPGANLQLEAGHVALAQAALGQARLVYGQFETALPAVTAALALAHAQGIVTVLNPSPWQAPGAALQACTHTVIVNEVEAVSLLALPQALAGSARDCATQILVRLAAFWQAWPSARCLIVTLGGQGSLALERPPGDGRAGALWHAGARPVRAVDTVGAGDAFASGYCAALLAGASVPQALRWGNACGAHLAAQAGVLGVLPTAATLQRLLARSDTPVAVALRSAA